MPELSLSGTSLSGISQSSVPQSGVYASTITSQLDADEFVEMDADMDTKTTPDDESDDRPLFKVVTLDGTTFIGRLVREDDHSITLDVEKLGELNIRRENIRSLTELAEDDLMGGKYWFPNPNATRYLFAPSAIPITRKTGYYQNTWIFFNNLNYGFTDRFSMGVGIVPIFLFGVNALPVWLLPKYSIPIKADKLHISAGAMIGGVIGSGGGGAGVLYSTLTYGNRNRNITGGLGYGFVEDGISDRPVINFSGMYRMSVRSYLISENHFIPIDSGYEGLWSIGYRYAPESFSFDFALIRPSGVSGGFIGIPWIGVTLPFDRN